MLGRGVRGVMMTELGNEHDDLEFKSWTRLYFI